MDGEKIPINYSLNLCKQNLKMLFQSCTNTLINTTELHKNLIEIFDIYIKIIKECIANHYKRDIDDLLLVYLMEGEDEWRIEACTLAQLMKPILPVHVVWNNCTGAF